MSFLLLLVSLLLNEVVIAHLLRLAITSLSCKFFVLIECDALILSWTGAERITDLFSLVVFAVVELNRMQGCLTQIQ